MGIALFRPYAPDDGLAWDEASGTWMVSGRAAEPLAVRASERHFSTFERTIAHSEGPFMSGTSGAPALTPEGARDLQRELVTFLQGGDFSWRFVSI